MHCHTVKFASSITMYVVTADYVKSAEIVRQEMSDDSKECPTCGTACEVCWTEGEDNE